MEPLFFFFRFYHKNTNYLKQYFSIFFFRATSFSCKLHDHKSECPCSKMPQQGMKKKLKTRAAAAEINAKKRNFFLFWFLFYIFRYTTFGSAGESAHSKFQSAFQLSIGRQKKKNKKKKLSRRFLTPETFGLKQPSASDSLARTHKQRHERTERQRRTHREKGTRMERQSKRKEKRCGEKERERETERRESKVMWGCQINQQIWLAFRCIIDTFLLFAVFPHNRDVFCFRFPFF